MSWWTNIRDEAVHYGSFGLGGSSIYDPRSSRHQESEMKQQAQAQIDAFKKQTELEQSELDRVRNEQDSEKRRVQEKQVRALRGQYRPGDLGVSDSGANDMSSKLGG